MDKRAFTGTLLAQIANQTAGPAAGGGAAPAPAAAPMAPASGDQPLVLVISDLPERQTIPILQEACALRRFGLQVRAMVPADSIARLARFAPPGALLDISAPAPEAVWGGLYAILAVPSQDLLARLALGLQDRPAAALLLQALWRGCTVYMDFSCTEQSDGQPCLNPAMAAFYRGYAERLQTLGAQPVLPGEYLITLRQQGRANASSCASPPPPPPPKPAAEGERAVITRSDVLAHDPSSGPWRLPAGAILTPLARDTAKLRGLVLEPAP